MDTTTLLIVFFYPNTTSKAAGRQAITELVGHKSLTTTNLTSDFFLPNERPWQPAQLSALLFIMHLGRMTYLATRTAMTSVLKKCRRHRSYKTISAIM